MVRVAENSISNALDEGSSSKRQNRVRWLSAMVLRSMKMK